ncbi:MAG: glycosyltransferase family 4 protein [Candidatus Sumerlaeota bacterium]
MNETRNTAALNILILNSARRWIGEAAHNVALAEALRKRGHKVVLALREGYEVEARAREAGLPVLSLRFTSRFHPLADLGDVRKIRRVCREEEIDLIHANRGKDHWSAAVARAFMKNPPPLVRSRHVVVPSRQHIANRWLFKHATQGLLCVSKAARASLGKLARNFHNMSEDETHLRDPDSIDRVILSSVDTERFHPEKRSQAVRREICGGRDPENLIIVGLIARMQRIKGQREFLVSAALLEREHPNVHFLLAGRRGPDHRTGLLEFAREKGLDPSKVTVLGMVDNLPEIMASLDIGAVASLGSEGSSRVSLEYMASGLPIVSTTAGGIPELLDEGEQAFLVNPGDSRTMAERLTRLVENPALRRRMGGAGRRTTEERHSVDIWVRQIEAFYRTVIVHSAEQ